MWHFYRARKNLMVSKSREDFGIGKELLNDLSNDVDAVEVLSSEIFQ